MDAVLQDPLFDLIAPKPNQAQDEFACLNLNITAPHKALKSDTRLPVLVWIHGGAFVMGSNADRYAALPSLVKESIKNGQPIIAVSLNYRLGYFGFLASKQLAAANANRGGGSGNWGLHDQRVALEWIQKNIASFGGDPSAVTVIGHSAGSASISAHILAGKPLFQRGILLSGVLGGVLGPDAADSPYTQGEYDDLQKQLNAKDVAGIESVSVEELTKAHAVLKGAFPAAWPVDDSHVKGGFFSLGRKDTHDWMYHPDATGVDAMVGDVRWEGNIFVPLVQAYGSEQLLSRLQKRLPSSILQYYKLDADSAPPATTSMGDIVPRMMVLCTDLPFSAPIAKFCATFPGTVYSYHWNRGNPFPGPMNGLAHHGVETSYCFGGHTPHFANDVDKELSQTFMKMIVEFVYGGAPWPARGTGDKDNSYIFGEDGKVSM
jgi:carboxylesterase type B